VGNLQVTHRGYFIGRLELYEMAGHNGRWFCLLEPLTYVDRDWRRYTAPAGTLTDFASVPRIVWMVIPKTGSYNRACVVHDHLCTEKKLPTRHVHDLFLRMLETCGVSTIVRLSMHRAVRWFGPRFKGGPA
jgi:hypothetical protein